MPNNANAATVPASSRMKNAMSTLGYFHLCVRRGCGSRNILPADFEWQSLAVGMRGTVVIDVVVVVGLAFVTWTMGKCSSEGHHTL